MNLYFEFAMGNGCTKAHVVVWLWIYLLLSMVAEINDRSLACLQHDTRINDLSPEYKTRSGADTELFHNKLG